jgi:hypothetical protein
MIIPALRYRTHSAFPIAGGQAIIPGETVIDTTAAVTCLPFMIGVIPPADVTPLDQATYNFLLAAYPLAGLAPNLPPIKPVGS